MRREKRGIIMTLNTKHDDEIKAIEKNDKALRAEIKKLNKQLDALNKKITQLSADKWADFDFDSVDLRNDAAALEEILTASFTTDAARDAIDKFIDSFGERFKRDGFVYKPLAVGVRFSLKKNEVVTDELVDTFIQLAKSTAAGRDEVILSIFEHGLSDNGVFYLHLSGENFENAKIRRDYYHKATFIFEGNLRDALAKISEKLWYDHDHNGDSEWFDERNF
jgi:hypothetical protein